MHALSIMKKITLFRSDEKYISTTWKQNNFQLINSQDKFAIFSVFWLLLSWQSHIHLSLIQSFCYDQLLAFFFFTFFTFVFGAVDLFKHIQFRFSFSAFHSRFRYCNWYLYVWYYVWAITLNIFVNIVVPMNDILVVLRSCCLLKDNQITTLDYIFI